MSFLLTINFVIQTLRILRGAGRTQPRSSYRRFRRPGGVRASAALGGMALLSIVVSTARATGTAAHARPSDPPQNPVGRTSPARFSEQSQRYWYGWQVLLFGETGAAFLSVALATHDVQSMQTWRTLLFFPVGLPTYAAGGPLVHFSNDYFGKGLISLGMTLTTPVAVGLIGTALACSRSDASPSCQTNGFFNSAAVAVLVVPLIDAAFLGWGEEVTERTITTSAVPWREIRPFFQLREFGQTLVGLGGRF